MTTLQFADTHNMVAFLTKSAESEGFEQIVDFQNTNPIRYALTINPTIYTSCIKQFWATVKVKAVNGEVQLQALVDGKKIIITELIVRRDLRLDDAEGVECLPNATIFEELTRMGAKTTAWNEFSSTMASAIICLATNQKFNFSKYIFESMLKNLDNAGKFLMYPRFIQVFLDNQLEGMATHTRTYIAPSHTKKIFSNMRRQGKYFSGRVTPLFPTMVVQAQEDMGEDEAVNEEPSMQLNELIDFCTKWQKRVLDLENTKTAQAQEITSLKLRFKRLEKIGGSRTHKLKILYKVGRSARMVSSDESSLGDQEDASKQERKIDDIDADAEIKLVDKTQGRHDDDLMFDTGVLNDEEVFTGQDMDEKEVSTTDPVTTVSEVVTTVNVVVSTISIIPVSVAATITEDEITLAQALAELKSVKTKVTTATTTATKGILLQEPSESRTTTTTIPSKDKGKGIIAEEPLKMNKKDQISSDEQEAIRLQAEFDEEAKIKTDYELAQRLQAKEQEELTIKEKSKLFVQLLEARKKHFAAKRVEEKRNRPTTKAQQRSIMYTYLKNMVGWNPKDLKNKSFANIQELFDKAMKRVNTFIDMDTELVEVDELEQEKAKKQKVDEDKETTKLQSLMKVILDEEEVAVDDIPLATKPPSIVDYKILKQGKISYYQIIRADGSSKRYSAFIQMLRSFDREDLETLWKLVKAKHGYTRPEEGYKRVL
ncbi:hypothetical protein Tco_1230119 [Tanacetum coccineum]